MYLQYTRINRNFSIFQLNSNKKYTRYHESIVQTHGYHFILYITIEIYFLSSSRNDISILFLSRGEPSSLESLRISCVSRDKGRGVSIDRRRNDLCARPDRRRPLLRSHSLLSRSPRSERRPCIEKAARSFRTYIALARHEVRSPLSSVLSRECPFRFPVSLRFRSLYLFLLLLLSPLDGVPGFVRPRRRANCVHYLSSRG